MEGFRSVQAAYAPSATYGEHDLALDEPADAPAEPGETEAKANQWNWPTSDASKYTQRHCAAAAQIIRKCSQH
jgi:hypothetical protein